MFLFMLIFHVAVFAQQADNMEMIARFAGVTDLEDLDAYDVERLEDVLRNPLRINIQNAAALEQGGVLSPYQLASLIDYRCRHGDILSFKELSCIDGFSEDIVEKISPFISLESENLQKRKSYQRPRHELTFKSAVKVETDYTYAMKYRLSAGDWKASLSFSRPYSDKKAYPDLFSGNLSWTSNRLQLVLGDFNARFGQGLCLWNSSITSALTTPSAFMKKPSGISPSYSFTGLYSLTGAALVLSPGRWKLTVLAAAPGIKEVMDKPERVQLMPAVNISRYCSSGQFSLTHMASFSDFLSETFRIPVMKTSADASFCFNGTNVFAEASYDWVSTFVEAVAGTDFRVSSDMRMAVLSRLTTDPDGENIVALSGTFSRGSWVRIRGRDGFCSSQKRHNGNFSASVSCFPSGKDVQPYSIQVKAQADWTMAILEWMHLKLRVSERYRTWDEPFRTDVRMDLSFMTGPLNASLRLNALNCVQTGLLTYVEGGYKSDRLTAYLRTGLFKIDNWDDRIYVYERDAPGSFNVPAFYGRGLWASLAGSWKFARWGRVHLRCSYTSYMFMEQQKRKPDKAEIKVQLDVRL